MSRIKNDEEIRYIPVTEKQFKTLDNLIESAEMPFIFDFVPNYFTELPEKLCINCHYYHPETNRCSSEEEMCASCIPTYLIKNDDKYPDVYMIIHGDNEIDDLGIIPSETIKKGD